MAAQLILAVSARLSPELREASLNFNRLLAMLEWAEKADSSERIAPLSVDRQEDEYPHLEDAYQHLIDEVSYTFDKLATETDLEFAVH